MLSAAARGLPRAQGREANVERGATTSSRVRAIPESLCTQ